jgi:hypothetical protein
VSHKSSQDSHIARTGDVDYVGAEVAHEAQDPGIVPQKQKIELVVSIERKLHPAAAQLHSGY